MGQALYKSLNLKFISSKLAEKYHTNDKSENTTKYLLTMSFISLTIDSVFVQT
jgi:hypothetical protein